MSPPRNRDVGFLREQRNPIDGPIGGHEGRRDDEVISDGSMTAALSGGSIPARRRDGGAARTVAVSQQRRSAGPKRAKTVDSTGDDDLLGERFAADNTVRLARAHGIGEKTTGKLRDDTPR
jgi:hypothetical protein